MQGKGTLLKGFGGRDRYLFYTARGWSAVSEHLDIRVRLGHFMEDLFQVPLPLSCFHVFLWGGLLHEEPDLTVDEVAGWVTEENVGDLMELFFERYGGTSGAGPAVAQAIALETELEAREAAAATT